MKKTLLSAASSIGIVTAALLFTGCGDSDSSSSSSTAGTQTGQFVKGPWKGIDYTRSNGVSGTTGVNGTFTYNPGENVTFDFGLGTAIWESGSRTGNSTNPAPATITSCVNPKTNAPWNITDAAKVSAIFSAYNVSENSTADLSTFVSSLKTKVASVYGSSFNISGNTTSLDSIVAGIGNITGGTITNATAATGGYATALINLVNTLASVTAANLPTGYNLSATNKVLVFSDGTTATGFAKVNNTAINVSGTVYNVLGALTGGVSLVSENASASAVAKVVAYNMTAGSVNPNGKSISLSINGVNNTYIFNGTTSGTYTLNQSGTVSVGNWTGTTDGLGIALVPTNSTGAPNGTNTTVTFEDDFTASNGVVAKIWSGAISSITSAYATLVEVVYSTATTVLKHLH